MSVARLSNRDIADLDFIGARHLFTNHGGTFSAIVPPLYIHDANLGRLNAEERRAFGLDFLSMTFIVYSYGTPIAWESDNGWHIVEQRFSVTTSRHQGIVRRALA